jgi:PTS system nitrogen regulatory IIA component
MGVTEPADSTRLPQTAPPPAAPTRLSALLAEPAILLFPEPIDKGELLRRLVTAVAGSPPAFDAADVLRRIERREGEASTFLSEGIALPHVRVPGLQAARVGLALPRTPSTGLAGIEAVFLFLCPEESPDLCLNLLATAARLFRDPASRAALGRAGSAHEALQVIRAWEDYPSSGKLDL